MKTFVIMQKAEFPPGNHQPSPKGVVGSSEDAERVCKELAGEMKGPFTTYWWVEVPNTLGDEE